MKKIVLSSLLLVSLANAGYIGSLVPDKKVGKISLSAGQASIGNDTNLMYKLSFGGTYYYNNGVMYGADFGLGYTQNQDTQVDNKNMFELDGQFKLGYSFGQLAEGFGVYGLVDFAYLMYNQQLKDKATFAQGIGYGGGLEYVLSDSWVVTSTYTTTKMKADTNEDFDYEKILIGIGYTW